MRLSPRLLATPGATPGATGNRGSRPQVNDVRPMHPVAGVTPMKRLALNLAAVLLGTMAYVAVGIALANAG